LSIIEKPFVDCLYLAPRQLKVNYVDIVANQCEAPVRDRVFGVVDGLETTNDPNVFSLYFLLQSLGPIIARNPKAYVDHIGGARMPHCRLFGTN
jgi:hypothetical protein